MLSPQIAGGAHHIGEVVGALRWVIHGRPTSRLLTPLETAELVDQRRVVGNLNLVAHPVFERLQIQLRFVELKGLAMMPFSLHAHLTHSATVIIAVNIVNAVLLDQRRELTHGGLGVKRWGS